MSESIDVLKSRLEILRAELKLKEKQVSELAAHIAELEWIPITWDDLEALLKSYNRPYNPSDYERNPRVSWRGGLHMTYCSLNEKGQLVIGPYFYNDRFRRGEPLYIHYQHKPWVGR